MISLSTIEIIYPFCGQHNRSRKPTPLSPTMLRTSNKIRGALGQPLVRLRCGPRPSWGCVPFATLTPLHPQAKKLAGFAATSIGCLKFNGTVGSIVFNYPLIDRFPLATYAYRKVAAERRIFLPWGSHSATDFLPLGSRRAADFYSLG